MTQVFHLSPVCGEDADPVAEMIGDFPEHVFRSAPSFGVQGDGPYDRRRSTGARPLRLYRLRNVYVGRRGVIFDAAGRIFAPHLAPFHEEVVKTPARYRYVTDPYRFRSTAPGEYRADFDREDVAETLEGPVFLASSYWEQAYTHFILELLPAILVYRDRLHGQMPLLLSADVAEARAGLLEGLGLEGRLLRKEVNSTVFVRELYVCDYPRFAAPETAALFRTYLAPRFDPATRGTAAPVYLARHDSFSWDRHVLNETPLIERMQAEGVEIFVPSHHPPEVQLDRLWRSKLVIGQYGGAIFSLLLGMTQKSSLILCSENYNRFDFDGMADLLGHRPVKLLCRSFTSRRDPNNSPFFVNPEPFYARIQAELAAAP